MLLNMFPVISKVPDSLMATPNHSIIWLSSDVQNSTTSLFSQTSLVGPVITGSGGTGGGMGVGRVGKIIINKGQSKYHLVPHLKKCAGQEIMKSLIIIPKSTSYCVLKLAIWS